MDIETSETTSYTTWNRSIAQLKSWIFCATKPEKETCVRMRMEHQCHRKTVTLPRWKKNGGGFHFESWEIRWIDPESLGYLVANWEDYAPASDLIWTRDSFGFHHWKNGMNHPLMIPMS